MTYAGFWIRVWASIIDTIVMLIVLIPTAIMIFGANTISTEVTNQNMSYWSSSFHMEGGGNILLNYIFPAILVLAFWFYKSATPGKMATRLTIVDAKTGKKPTPIQFLLRYVGYFLSSIFLLGFIWIAFDPRKQGWHDKLAGTVVVRDSTVEEVKFEE
jgi:uncharacterized RDD family membrane protein YckC